MKDNNYLYELVCEAMGRLAAAQTIDDPAELKRLCASVEHSLRVDVLPEIG